MPPPPIGRIYPEGNGGLERIRFVCEKPCELARLCAVILPSGKAVRQELNKGFWPKNVSIIWHISLLERCARRQPFPARGQDRARPRPARAAHTGRAAARPGRAPHRARGGKAAAVRAQRRGKIDAAPPLDSAARRCYAVSINQQEVSGRCAGNFRFMIQPFSREEYALPREAPAAGNENPCACPLFLRPFSRAVFPLPVFGERSFLYRHLCLLSMPFPLSKGKRAPQARAGGGGISIFPLLLETSKASRPCTRG